MKIKDIFVNIPINGGIFNKMNEMYDLPFKDMIEDFKLLDLDFISLYGNRESSTLLDTILSTSPNIDDNRMRMLSTIIYQKFHIQWGKLYNTMKLEYNPIHNYDMKETEKTSAKVTTDGNSLDGTYGFNSSNSVPHSDSKTSSTVHADLDDNVRKLERAGNIGVTTSQKMLSDERNVWLYDFIDTIFKQVARMLTCKVYSIL